MTSSRTVLLVLFLTLCSATQRSHAQPPPAEKRTELRVDVHLESLLERPLLSAFPTELFSEFFLDAIGVDLMKSKYCSFFVRNVNTSGATYGLAFYSPPEENPIRITPTYFDVVEDRIGDETIGFQPFKTIFGQGSGWGIAVVSPDLVVVCDRQFAFSEALFQGLVRQQPMQATDMDAGDITTVINRDFIQAYATWIEESSMIADPQLVEILNLPASFTIDIDFKTDVNQECRLVFDSESDAKATFDFIETFIDKPTKPATASLASDIPFTPAWTKYTTRIRSTLLKQISPRLDERTIRFEFQFTEQLVSSIVVFSSQYLYGIGNSEVTNTINHLSKLGSGLILSGRENGSIIGRTIESQTDGQPLLSWRVAILPYIGEQELYDRIHIDEPWDSEHNLRLLPSMPDCFKDRRLRSDTHTTLQAIMGKDTLMSRNEGVELFGIPDGLANTIWVVATLPANAVPWTAPQDFELNQEYPFEGLVDFWSTGFCVGTIGNAKFLRMPLDRKWFLGATTLSGGERVEMRNIRN
jgi:hypothetical protein